MKVVIYPLSRTKKDDKKLTKIMKTYHGEVIDVTDKSVILEFPTRTDADNNEYQIRKLGYFQDSYEEYFG